MVWKGSQQRRGKRIARINLERLGLSPKESVEVSIKEIRRQVQGIAQAGRTMEQGARSRIPHPIATEVASLRSHGRGAKR